MEEQQPSTCRGRLVAGCFSINFEARSLHENAEESLPFYDRDFGGRLEATFAEDENCREITYEKWKRRSLEQRLAEIISNLFNPLY